MLAGSLAASRLVAWLASKLAVWVAELLGLLEAVLGRLALLEGLEGGLNHVVPHARGSEISVDFDLESQPFPNILSRLGRARPEDQSCISFDQSGAAKTSLGLV